METTKKKKIASLLLCLTFALAVSIPAGTAFASNWQDKYYEISSEGHGYTYTPAQHKDDRTSSWDECRDTSETHTVQIAAESYENGPVVAYPGPKALWWTGKKDYILNNIRENGYEWATLVIEGSPYVWAWGYWSPDSI